MAWMLRGRREEDRDEDTDRLADGRAPGGDPWSGDVRGAGEGERRGWLRAARDGRTWDPRAHQELLLHADGPARAAGEVGDVHEHRSVRAHGFGRERGVGKL